ncbi:MAG TPA: hypothetical protein PKX48_05235 [Planctomycetota bacterium]|jgi:hypothetical protein|nr:hypothetical protein [Planctomycetota bacterium]OQC20313.1 MAG: hypothetical protein BWX69_01955 [Planctomycetes bacterium ADurb.Bin069]NMD35288.1 hypothetical protein [Planctomycetota bacterium]HNR98272.1 hypothetical protein [Planctomycetota bacterium]HNU24860.1 hypothetical protein [Planctomycetota bacterium]
MDYRSKRRCLGLPLIHIARGRVEDGSFRRGVAKGWIAVGDIAFGPLFALGGIAVGGLAIGGFGAGVFALGGIAFGGLAFGGEATGIGAAGGLAVGLYFAAGGLAIAWHVAAGGLAVAAHANDAEAARFFSAENLAALVATGARHALPFLLIPVLLVFQALVRRSIAPEEPNVPDGAGDPRKRL